MSIRIAKAAPFEGVPHINMPRIYGVYTGKEMFYRIPVTGKRPIDIKVSGLCDGLLFKDGIISGTVDKDCEFSVKIEAVNELGNDSAEIRFVVGEDKILLTPLMGFTTWNAFDSTVNQEKVEKTAELLDSLGIAEYGYNYVNVDSGWQKEYGGEFGGIIANDKFPDMKGMCRKLHSMGFKCGIYSTPMKQAWGCPAELESIPGCTTGEFDTRFVSGYGEYIIGLEHHDAQCVKQWEDWGFDYLKYDWSPADPINADIMKKELLKSKRAIAFCVTVAAKPEYADYWKNNCNSWRNNSDSIQEWFMLGWYIDSVDKWENHVCRGHYYDLDMLEIGLLHNYHGERYLTDHEELFAYTLRAFFFSPIQLSCDLSKLTDFEFDMICNEEIIAIHQDALCQYPKLIDTKDKTRAYKRELANGDYALALFNMGDSYINYSLELGESLNIRDLWRKEDLGEASTLNCSVKAHCVRVFRLSKIS